MNSKCAYRLMKADEADYVYDLILRVFQEHVAPVYSTDGVEKFLGMLSIEWLCEVGKGINSFVILAKHQNKPIGMLAVINENHITLIFVDPKYQGEGIGKRLIDEATRLCIEKSPAIKAITVSASPNSISFYQTIGFEAQGEEVDEDGMRFVPMQKIIKQKFS